MKKTTAAKPFASLRSIDLRIVKGAATLSGPTLPRFEGTRTNYGVVGPLGVDDRDCD